MIDFQRLDINRKAEYDAFLRQSGRGCEYSFTNLYIWGKQEVAMVGDSMVFFSQFNRTSVYPFPIIRGDAGQVLDTIIADAGQRGIRCRLTSMTDEDRALLESLYPGRFSFHNDRDCYDYVYPIGALADLKGKKLQKKRNHLNRFRLLHPKCQTVVLTPDNLDLACRMAERWFEYRQRLDPDADFYLERKALKRAFCRFRELELEGLVLLEGDDVIAMTMGSRLSGDTFDVHFEKAREDVDGAYVAINNAFACYLREKYPELRYLNREDDMGIPGLRKAKLSYYPEYLVEKSWAKLLEEDDED